MPHFMSPIRPYMSHPVRTVGPDIALPEVQQQMHDAHVSSLAVVDPHGTLLGVVSRTDLLAVGRREAGMRLRAPLLTLPNKPVREVMTADVLTMTSEDTLTAAARLMTGNHAHRVFIVDDGTLAGVLSTKDLLHAIVDKRDNEPIKRYMSSPAFVVRAREPISLATERLEKAHVTGLVVVDDEWPVGVFTQPDALAARELPRETPVEDVMNPAMLCLDQDTPLHRAAAQAAALGVRRVLAMSDRRVVGILTGLDFAKVVADAD